MSVSSCKLVSGLALLVMLAGVQAVAAQTAARQLESLAIFERNAGEPVASISNFSITDWRPLGPANLALWRTAGKAWLLDLRSPCFGLEFAQVIRLRSATSTISARFDQVEFRDGIGPSARLERCRIERIRPVDYIQVRREENLARKERKTAASRQ